MIELYLLGRDSTGVAPASAAIAIEVGETYQACDIRNNGVDATESQGR